MVKRCWLVLVVLLAHSALCSAKPPKAAPSAETNAYSAWKTAAVRALIEHADAHSLVTAAMLSSNDGPDLAARASELAPDSTPIAWVRLRLCAVTAGCDFRDAATAMRWVDADNPAAWLPTLAVAQKEKDTVEIDRVLLDMALAKHFDLYANPMAVLMFDTLKAASKELPRNYAVTDASRLALIMAVASAKLIPSFATVEEACRESTAGTERRDACLKIARRMQHGDTVGGEIAGLMLEKHFLAADAKEAHALGERRRVLEWQQAAARKFDEPLLPWVKNAHARWRLARMRAMRREQEVILAILREQGTPLAPPEGKQ
jgi:hypothetical protein